MIPLNPRAIAFSPAIASPSKRNVQTTTSRYTGSFLKPLQSPGVTSPDSKRLRNGFRPEGSEILGAQLFLDESQFFPPHQDNLDEFQLQQPFEPLLEQQTNQLSSPTDRRMSLQEMESPRAKRWSSTAGEETFQPELAELPLSPNGSFNRFRPKVCKFFLMGECKLVNCSYLHTMESTSAVCRYWLRGNCLRGSQCRFLHELVDDQPSEEQQAKDYSHQEDNENSAFNWSEAFPPFHPENSPDSQHGESVESFRGRSPSDSPFSPPSSLLRSKSSPLPIPVVSTDLGPLSKSSPPSNSSTPFRLDSRSMNHYPDLPTSDSDAIQPGLSSTSSSAPDLLSSNPSQASGYLTMASRIKLQDLQTRLFPHVSSSVVETSFKSFGCHFDKTGNFLTKEYGPIPEHLKSIVQPGPELPAPIPHPSINYGKNRPAKVEKWVETGTVVAHMYAQKRSSAIEHAESRNSLFQKATEAYLRGDGKSAKEFSEKGRFHDERMKRDHSDARDYIFEQRNKDFEKPSTNRRTIDLHGLHRTEALEILEAKLNEISRIKSVETLDILFGTGHHSQSGKSVLRPVILEFLAERKFRHRPFSVGGRGGAVRVLFDSKKKS